MLELVFKKYFWTAQVGFAVVAALLLAGAVNGFFARTYAEYSVAVPETAMEALPAGADSPTIPIEINPDGMPRAAADEEPDRCAEVECEEDEECNPETGECEPVEEAEVETGPDGRCIESDIAINLVGTMVADDPEWSVAILRNPSLNQTQFATLGTNLLAEADVTRIERNRIFIVRNGREECLRPGTATDRQRRAGSSSGRSATPESPRSGSRPVRRDTRSTASAAPAAASGSQTIEQRIRSGVTRSDDGSYEIERSLIEEVANNQSLMEQQAPRVVPNYVNGQPRGFRLQGIRSGSMFSAIGIRNGDVITSVNGTEIDSPQRALELYQAMMQQSDVRMSILRRGREQTLVYTIK